MKLPAAKPASGIAFIVLTLLTVGLLELLRSNGILLPNPGPILLLLTLAGGYAGGVRIGLICAALLSVHYAYYFEESRRFDLSGIDIFRLSVFTVTAVLTGVIAGRLGAHAKRSRSLIAELQSAGEQLRASRAERESEARLKSQILDGLGADVALVNAQGIIVAANSGWTRFVAQLGRDAFCPGSSYIEAMDACNWLRPQTGAEPIRRVLAGEIPEFNTETHCPHHDRWFRISITPVDLPEGRGAVVMHTDITGRRRAEQDLRHSRAVLEQAQAVASIGSWEWNVEADTLEWSAETFRIFGVEPAEFDSSGRWFDSRVHPEDLPRISAAARASIRERSPFAVEFRILRDDGQIRWLQERAEVVSEESEPVRMLGVVQDITDRKLAQDALQESERRYRLLFDLSPLPTWAYDRGTRRFLAVNNAAVRHYGFSRDEFLAMTVDQLITTGDESAAGADRARERFHVRRDGSVIEVEARTDSIVFAGREAVVSVVTDVTERRRSERLLAGQNLVLGLLASGMPIPEVLTALAEMLDRQHPGVRCAILLTDESGSRLTLGAAPGVPAEFCEALTRLPMGPSATCCGAAIYYRERIIVEDIATDPLWEGLRVQAQAAGIRACWCQPILTGDGRVQGTFVMYSAAARAPRKSEIKTLESSAYIAGIAIERSRAESAIHARERMLRLQMEQMPAACIVHDRSGAIIQWNPAAERIFGWTAEEAIGQDAVDLLVPEQSRPTVREILSRSTGSIGATSNRNTNRTKAGRDIVCEWQNAAIHDEDGRVIGVMSMAQDVTERLAAEQALRRSEQLNRRIIEHMPGGLVQVGMDGAIRKANRIAMEHLGLSYNELTERYISGFAAETIDESGNPLPHTEYPVYRCLQSGRPEGPRTIGVRRRDGQVAWGVYTAIPLHRPDGEQDGSLVTFLDITERKHFEEVLRESEERFRFAQASANAGTYDWDASDRLVWTDSTYALFGVEPGTPVTGESWLQMVHPDDQERIIQQRQQVMCQRLTEFRFDYRINHPTAGVRWIATLGRCIFDEQGNATRVAGIHIDITQLKQAQSALARSEERYRRLAEFGAMGIWEVAYETGETIFANPALCRMLEVSGPEELKGLNFRSFFTLESLRVLERELAKRARGEASSYEVELMGRRGGRRHVMISGAPAVDQERNLQTLIGTFTDITDRKVAEDALRRAQKIDAVGRLASGVAHDFNNLLTAIFGFTSLARRTLSANHPATRALDRVDEAAQQASGVTKALLTFTRQDQSEKKPVRLCDIVEESARLLRRTLPSDVELRTSVPPTPVWVLADRTQLHQVVMNLAINARDAMPDGGRLKISVDTHPAELNGDGSALAARLTVTDNGCGMSPAVVSRIFEPFFTTKPEGEGTGLGLPIIHGIVENHHGRIEVDSAPGRGTTFHILLPQTDPCEERQSCPIAPHIRGQGELVLLADNHAYIRELMASMLLSMGYQVAQAPDAATLLEHAAAAAPPRLLIADADLASVHLPEVLRRLRESGAAVPIILMSASAEVAATSGDPEVSFLRKPFQMTELASAVTKALHTTPSTAP